MTAPYALVTWRTVERHSVRVTVSQLAALLGVPEAEVRGAGTDIVHMQLVDTLGPVEQDGETHDGCTREDITIELLCERCGEPDSDIDPAAGLCPTCTTNNDTRVVL